MLGIREARQRRAAEAARDDLEAVADFQSSMLGKVDAEQAGRRLIAAMRERLADQLRRKGAGEERILEALAAFDTSITGSRRP